MVVLISPNRFSELDLEKSVLEPLGVEVVQADSEEEFRSRAELADALLVTATAVNETLIETLRRCKAIVRYGVGVDVVDVDAATRHGIPVGNVLDSSVSEVADHAVTLALMLLRRVPESATAIARGAWSLEPVSGVGRLSELTAGILGFGRIGRAVAQRLEGFGMRIVAHDPFLREGPVPLLSLEEVLRQSDVVTLHLPLTDETKGIMSRERIALLRSNAVLINVSRGGLIDEHALGEMLLQNRLWGAGLDVFQVEPLPLDHSLRRSPHTILTPHSAWYSEQALKELRTKAAEQAARALRGNRLDPVVNPTAYDISGARI